MIIIGTLFNVYNKESIPSKENYRRKLKSYFDDDIFDLVLQDIDKLSLDWYLVLRKKGINPEVLLNNSDKLDEKSERIDALNNSDKVNWYDPIIDKSIIKRDIGICIDKNFDIDSEFIEYSNSSDSSFLKEKNFRSMYRRIRSKKDKENYINNKSNILIADKFISDGMRVKSFCGNFYWREEPQIDKYIMYNENNPTSKNDSCNVVGKIVDKQLESIDLSNSIDLENKNNQYEILYDIPKYRVKLINNGTKIKDSFSSDCTSKTKNFYLKPRDEHRINIFNVNPLSS